MERLRDRNINLVKQAIAPNRRSGRKIVSMYCSIKGPVSEEFALVLFPTMRLACPLGSHSGGLFMS